MIRLKHKQESIVEPKHPFNFEGTLHKPSHFPSPTDKYEKGILAFCMNWKYNIYGIKLSENEKKIQADIYSKIPLSNDLIDEIKEEIRFRFDMNSKLSKFTELAEKDPVLKSIEKKWRGMRPSCAYSLYELICISLVLQNAQVSRSVKMLNAMLTSSGKQVSFDNYSLFAFWCPEDLKEVKEEELRALKVGYRAKSFLRVSDFFTKNPDFEFKIRDLPKQQASEQLQKIYGIGPASTWYLLFEKFHHYDAFDYVSPWENKILSMIIFGKIDRSAEDVLNYAKEKWSNYRMLAVHYIFEDTFWKRKNENIDWLNKLIRL